MESYSGVGASELKETSNGHIFRKNTKILYNVDISLYLKLSGIVILYSCQLESLLNSAEANEGAGIAFYITRVIPAYLT